MSHGPDGDDTTPVLRADAERNRRQLVAAARRVFAQEGPTAPLERIAAAAGVGVGTLYRRFPDRTTLVVAVIHETLASLVTETATALAEEPRAWDALVRTLGRSRDLGLDLRLDLPFPPETARAVRHDPGLVERRSEFAALLEELVAVAQQEGTMRTDVGTGDVLQLFVAARPHPGLPGDVAGLAAARTLAILLDGLALGPGPLLPGRPLTSADLRFGRPSAEDGR